ncbi:hypothetical protein GIB67_026917 [Kingdonia uniflora]|uniref:GDSL esterase/lipase n=1 Tax=Kingdonia uniflora TaxID=39325 RepID=A0A7J7P1W5_9MAGN|nr:hypothetical protein GIB67_026917 [Kingdonia uniflora]
MAHQSNYQTCLLFLQPLLLVCSVGAKVPSIIVFGDSTVDAGNNNQIPTIVKSNFDPYGQNFEGGEATGRFSNGRLPTEFISERFGTGYDNITSHLYSVIPLWKEFEYFKEYQEKLTSFLGKIRAKALLNEELYVISLGTNDFILNYYVIPARSSQFTVEEYQNFLIGIAENFIFDIYSLGARKIAIAGLFPIGCLPLERSQNLLSGRACREDYNKVAKDYNVKLQRLVAKLSEKLTSIKLVFLNVYDPIQEAIEKPSKYGFENVDLGCCGTGTIEFGLACNLLSIYTCVDASKYAFWDAIHPSENLYKIISNRFMRTSLAKFK